MCFCWFFFCLWLLKIRIDKENNKILLENVISEKKTENKQLTIPWNNKMRKLYGGHRAYNVHEIADI